MKVAFHPVAIAVGRESLPLRCIHNARHNSLGVVDLRLSNLIGTVNCAKTVPINRIGLAVQCGSRSPFLGHSAVQLLRLPPTPSAHRLRSVGGLDVDIPVSQERQTVHLAPRFFASHVVVVANHVAIAVTQPTHQHLFGDLLIRGRGTEEVPEAVQPAGGDPRTLVRRREIRRQWPKHIPDENVPDGVGLDFATARTVKHAMVRRAG